MIPTAFSLEARRSRGLVLGLAAVTAVYAAGMTYFYTNIVANAEEWQKLLDIYPKELLIAFGIEGNFADPGVYLSGYIFNFLWPLIAAIVAIALATRIAMDADRGFLDTALATRLTRTRHLLASIGAQLGGLVVLAIVMTGGIAVGDFLIEPDLPTGPVLLTTFHAAAFGVAIAGPATWLAVTLLDRSRAAGIVAGALVLMYMLNVIAALAPEWEVLATVSLFRYFNVKELISDSIYPFADSLLFVGLGVAGWAGALVSFRRRDIAA